MKLTLIIQGIQLSIDAVPTAGVLRAGRLRRLDRSLRWGVLTWIRQSTDDRQAAMEVVLDNAMDLVSRSEDPCWLGGEEERWADAHWRHRWVLLIEMFYDAKREGANREVHGADPETTGAPTEVEAS